MKSLDKRLQVLKGHVEDGAITVMVMGLGSVGTYLLDYLISRNDPALKVVVVGRNADKLESDSNIVRIGALIRGLNRSQIVVEPGVDFNNIEQMADCIGKHKPDFLVNSSRAYSGLKYGSISWKHLRSYGIWSPLAVKYTRNIMEAAERADADAIVINTSYSDAVIPWLKSAKKGYPDFGSGNLNHLVPRMKYAAAALLGAADFWNIDITLATGHFHDVVISKEGHSEGVDPLLQICYQGKEVSCDLKQVIARCQIPMPVDAKRNMMNASSNYEIITAIIDAIRNKEKRKIHSPGAFGEMGGYPVIIDGSQGKVTAEIDTSVFKLGQMQQANGQSLALDGVEGILDGSLFYTDKLLEKVWGNFGVQLPKSVGFDEIDEVADKIIQEIITPTLKAGS